VARSTKKAATLGVPKGTNSNDAIPGVRRATPYNPRNRQVRSVSTEAMLSAMEMTSIPLEAKNLVCRRFPLAMMCEMAGAVLDPKTGELMEYRHLVAKPKYCEVWSKANAKELGRLAQGLPGVAKGTNTLNFIGYEQIPNDRQKDVTYARICCNYRPEKEDSHRERITVKGDLINYPHDVGTPTADMLLVKLLFNSIVSTKGA
jgi:hypothetical protein